MRRFARLAGCRSGSAAVEMALVVPLLLALLFGSTELGNYFLDEHILVKAVRDGARYAGRQDFSNFSSCSGEPGGTVAADTRTLVMTGLLSGGSNRLANWTSTTISVTSSCTTTAGVQTLGGIYNGNRNSSGTLIGAPIVTVTATVPYTPLLASAFGFSGTGYNLYASQQAAVAGI
ncbi:MAG: TadE/TadG family type IV pilus assembly protein [Sphingomicrobium sp.]